MTSRRPTPPRAPKPSGVATRAPRAADPAQTLEEAAGLAPRTQDSAPTAPRSIAPAAPRAPGTRTSKASTRPGRTGRTSGSRRSSVTRRTSAAPASSSPAHAPNTRGSSRPPTRAASATRRPPAPEPDATGGLLGGPRLSVGGNFSVSWRLLLFALVCAVAFILITPTLRLYVSQREAERTLNEQVAAAEARNQELTRQIDRWSDPAFVEAQARERLGYVLPGQQPYVVVDPEVVVGEEQQQAYEQSLASYSAPSGPWYAQVMDSVEIAGNTPAAGAEAADGVAPEEGAAPVEGSVPADGSAPADNGAPDGDGGVGNG